MRFVGRLAAVTLVFTRCKRGIFTVPWMRGHSVLCPAQAVFLPAGSSFNTPVTLISSKVISRRWVADKWACVCRERLKQTGSDAFLNKNVTMRWLEIIALHNWICLRTSLVFITGAFTCSHKKCVWSRRRNETVLRLNEPNSLRLKVAFKE